MWMRKSGFVSVAPVAVENENVKDKSGDDEEKYPLTHDLFDERDIFIDDKSVNAKRMRTKDRKMHFISSFVLSKPRIFLMAVIRAQMDLKLCNQSEPSSIHKSTTNPFGFRFDISF